MKPLLERLATGGCLVGDGAMGTMLFERGLAPGEPPESVTLSRPAVLEEIAHLYVEAGSDLVETNTFGGSPLKLALHGLEARAEAINRDAVRRARAAAGSRVYVVGSCGPCGRLLEPYGDASAEAVYVSFRRQMEWLIAAGVDAVCIETMTDLAEAGLAIRAARDVSPSIPLLATMTFDVTPRGYFTIMGVTVAAAATGLEQAGANVVGSNCGTGIEDMIAIARAFRRHTRLPIVVQPNAGLPKTVDGSIVYDETPGFMAEQATELLEIGVAIVGGCCGTTPDHVAALRRVVDGRPQPSPAAGAG
jgi:5-methyltetrahydrofolate--homocysteine methyltransferase